MAKITFKQVAPVVEEGARSERRETPSHAVTIAAQVGIPFLRSLIITAAGTGGVAWARAELELPTFLTPLSGFVIFIAFWMRESGIFQGLLWDLEERFDKDLDNDKIKGRPEVYTDHLEVEVKDQQGRTLPGGISTEDIGWNRAACISFFAATVDNPIFTEARWVKTVEFKGSPTFFRRVMVYLEEEGVLEKVGEGRNATRQFTRAGLAIARKIAALPH